MIKKVIAITAISTLLLFACKKEKEACDVNALPTTPYTLKTPNSVTWPLYTLPANNPLTVEGVQLGRMLFYDPILSADSTQSCASCHQQQNAFTDSNRFSTGIHAKLGKRNAMPLFNLVYHIEEDHFFWDGRASSMQMQALMPIVDPLEMADDLPNVMLKLNRNQEYKKRFAQVFKTETITAEHLAKALEQFELTLLSTNSKFDKAARGEVTLTASELNGKRMFNLEPDRGGADCFHCHGNILFTNLEMQNNGIDSTLKDFGYGNVTNKRFDDGKFKVPSLRNLKYTAPYMSTGEFKTLDEVLTFYDTGIQVSRNLSPLLHGLKDRINFTAQQKTDLINFLNTLNDEEFVTNPAFSNPF